LVAGLIILIAATSGAHAAEPGLSIRWEKNWLYVAGPNVAGDEVRVHYLEAYCRPGSTDVDWRLHTVVGHQTELVAASDDGKHVELRCRLNDGVTARHVITAGTDEVDFRVTITNPTDQESEAHWAQPCIRLADFTGGDQQSYLSKCFIFLDGKPARLPTEPWATEARYVPGQVYCPKHVDRNDVNPRPLSSLVPNNGLAGVFSADEKTMLATAWEPYQELFQGGGVCMHSDFRIGGLRPGETKHIRGKIYNVLADAPKLVERYERDFPEHAQ
jgi:hypothetical protein